MTQHKVTNELRGTTTAAQAAWVMYKQQRKRVFIASPSDIPGSDIVLRVLADDILQVVFEYPQLNVRDSPTQGVEFDRIDAVLGEPMVCPIMWRNGHYATKSSPYGRTLPTGNF